jgi:hypothetical protein
MAAKWNNWEWNQHEEWKLFTTSNVLRTKRQIWKTSNRKTLDRKIGGNQIHRKDKDRHKNETKIKFNFSMEDICQLQPMCTLYSEYLIVVHLNTGQIGIQFSNKQHDLNTGQRMLFRLRWLFSPIFHEWSW